MSRPTTRARAKASATSRLAQTQPRSQAQPTASKAPSRAPVKAESDDGGINDDDRDDAAERRAASTTSARKRKRGTAVKNEESTHNGVKKEEDEQQEKEEKADEAAASTAPRSRSRAAKNSKPSRPSRADLSAGATMAAGAIAAKDAQTHEPAAKKAARAKANPYGLSPGQSPYPSYAHPTAAECAHVAALLSEAHGAVAAPKTIPTPSLHSSGCGEVPSVLDALIRTRLSAATNNANSSRAFRGLVERFGLLRAGVGKGSVNWNAVRLAPQRDVFEAIRSGGLAEVKSRDIKTILDMVHTENQERRAALVEGGEDDGANGDGAADGVKPEANDGAACEADQDSPQAAATEIAKADSDVISLDHLHLLTSEEAFTKLLTYPGVGPKTASCVLLFCLQRPSFAVDTHVFRLTKWLGWVPAAATRNSTYAHLDVRVPDELKYALHYLLIRHGKACARCSLMKGRGASEGRCVLAGLMRKGKAAGDGGGGGRKTGGKGKGKGTGKKEAAEADEEEEQESESSGLSDLESEDEDDEDDDDNIKDEHEDGDHAPRTEEA